MVEAIRQGDIPGVQLRRRQLLAADPTTAWAWLTEPPRLAAWLGESSVEPGANGSLEVRSAVAAGSVERGTTVEWSPRRRWSLAYRRTDEVWDAATRLTFELAGDDPAVELSVLHQGFENLSLSVCLTVWEAYRRHWQASLARLAEELSRGARPGAG